MKSKKTLITAIILYFLSTSISFAAFNYLQTAPGNITSPLPTSQMGLLIIDPAAPRDQQCPLNGKMFTEIERKAWEEKRPLAIMIENSPDARPHSGVIKADIVYEAVAEGGVTRFMGVYYCDAQANDVIVAPVRSVRTYFIDWASEYGETPLFAHVGGANCSADPGGPCKTALRARAIEQMLDYGWRYAKGNDLDQFAVGAPTYLRNESRLGHRVATEHSVVTSTNFLWEEGIERGWTNVDPEGVEWSENFTPWKFQDNEEESDRGSISSISFEHWEGYEQFAVKWEYDSSGNQYLRSTGGQPHIDLETDKQLSASNVVIQFTKELGSVDELKHVLYTTVGKGKALIFQNGQVIEGTWSKSKRTARTIFKDSKGSEVTFAGGQIWIHVLATNTDIDY